MQQTRQRYSCAQSSFTLSHSSLKETCTLLFVWPRVVAAQVLTRTHFREAHLRSAQTHLGLAQAQTKVEAQAQTHLEVEAQAQTCLEVEAQAHFGCWDQIPGTDLSHLLAQLLSPSSPPSARAQQC